MMFMMSPTPPMIPPTWRGLINIMSNQSQVAQLPYPELRTGQLVERLESRLPEWIACFPNSSWTNTFTRQLTMITQSATKPASAPRAVVAINSPDPTIEPSG